MEGWSYRIRNEMIICMLWCLSALCDAIFVRGVQLVMSAEKVSYARPCCNW